MSEVSQEELKLINSYTRKNLTADEVYTFSVVLCDNDIDRDNEYFTSESIEKLAQLFVGVTGIYDHDPKATNQVARIYSCRAERDTNRKTAYGADYVSLTAKAYIPVCDSSREIISLLDGGIRKEVSVGCSIGKCECSVCGNDMRTGNCSHVKGAEYGGVKCVGILKEPRDAYEWSFTAVPAQRNAGVTKSFSCEDGEELTKRLLKTSGSVTIGSDEAKSLKTYIEHLKKQAEDGDKYKSFLELEAVKSGIMAKVGIESGLLEKMVQGLDVAQLLRLKEQFEKKAASMLPIRSQTAWGNEEKNKSESNTEFFI